MIGLTVRATLKTNLDRIPRAVREELRGSLRGLGDQLLPKVRIRSKVHRGRTARSYGYRMRTEGPNEFIDIFSNTVAAAIDELGLEPGVFPPFKVGSRLYEWVKDKGLTAKKRDRRKPKVRKGRRRAGKPVNLAAARRRRARFNKLHPSTRRAVLRQNAIKRVAFAMAVTIYRKGIRAGQPLQRTLDENERLILRTVNAAVKRALKGLQ